MNQTHLDILRRYWGYDSFRGIQQQIIESIAGGKDTLGLMPGTSPRQGHKGGGCIFGDVARGHHRHAGELHIRRL